MPLSQPFQLPWRLDVGDRIPHWRLPSILGKEVSAGDFVGKPVVLCFSPPHEFPAYAAGFAELFGEFQRLNARVLAVIPGPIDAAKELAGQAAYPFPLLADEDATVTYVFAAGEDQVIDGQEGLVARPTTIVIDPNSRVLRRASPDEPQTHAREMLEFIRGYLHQDPARPILQQAPVLLIPRVLSPEFCRELIGLWEKDNAESGFMVEQDGQTVSKSDYGHKIRRDHYLEDSEVKNRIRQAIFHRVLTEIWIAYNFEATRFEDFRIVGYDSARGGYFRPHRDNTTSGTAHRVWAMTINLNAGEYKGGYLRFPEYGPHLYRPETGAAVIFSCSLLHEATDVTAGRRFALLSFLYGDQQARMREELARRIGGEYRVG
jgi:peroxiredoxin/predicted 2-oxoglutarate/Fe(II)-dependent dioxygenase YbiX